LAADKEKIVSNDEEDVRGLEMEGGRLRERMNVRELAIEKDMMSLLAHIFSRCHVVTLPGHHVSLRS
jgi:hypothetical protein